MGEIYTSLMTIYIRKNIYKNVQKYLQQNYIQYVQNPMGNVEKPPSNEEMMGIRSPLGMFKAYTPKGDPKKMHRECP